MNLDIEINFLKLYQIKCLLNNFYLKIKQFTLPVSMTLFNFITNLN